MNKDPYHNSRKKPKTIKPKKYQPGAKDPWYTRPIHELTRWWKQLVAILVVISIMVMPEKFIVYNLDMGFSLITAIGGLLLARVAKSALDSWQSKPQKNKNVSVSRFMAESRNQIAKAVVHAAQIISIALIVMAALSRG